MATRFHFQSVSSGLDRSSWVDSVGINSTYPTGRTGGGNGVVRAVDASWDFTSDFQSQHFMLPLMTKTGQTIRSSQSGANGLANQDLFHSSYLSGPLQPQTISGTMKGMFWSQRQVDAIGGMSTQLVARVVSNDGMVVRGTLFGGHSETTAVHSIETYYSARRFPWHDGTGVAVTPVVCLEGDRILVEIGFRYHGLLPSGGGQNGIVGNVVVQPESNQGDLLDTEGYIPTTNLQDWIEFSGVILLHPVEVIEQAYGAVGQDTFTTVVTPGFNVVPPVGNTLVVLWTSDSSRTVSTITGCGATFIQAIRQVSSSGYVCEVWIGRTADGIGANLTITASTAGYQRCVIKAYAGVSQSVAVTTVGVNRTVTTGVLDAVSPAITPTAVGQQLLTMSATDTGSNSSHLWYYPINELPIDWDSHQNVYGASFKMYTSAQKVQTLANHDITLRYWNIGGGTISTTQIPMVTVLLPIGSYLSGSIG